MTLSHPEMRFQPIEAFPIGQFRDYVFWRFWLELPMKESAPQQFLYEIDALPEQSWSFHVAAQNDRQWRWAFTSCNGFSLSVPQETRDKMGGLGALWQDLLNKHADSPFFVMVGGGDQVYADAVWRLDVLKEWLALKGKTTRAEAPFSDRMEQAVQEFYFNLYMDHFSTPVMRDALASIPMVNMLDDHDLFDGFGSNPEYLEQSNVFQGLRRIGYLYYLLFQHQTNPKLAEVEDFIGASRKSYSVLKQFGSELALLAVDARAERTRSKVISDETWNEIFARVSNLPSTVKHLVVVTGVPIVYPRLESIDGFLASFGRMKRATNEGFNKVADGMGNAVKKVFGEKANLGFRNSYKGLKMALGKSGMMKSVLNHFGEPELADDLIDHWTNEAHDEERTMMIKRFQVLSSFKQMRITFLAGDVHCCGAGRFYGHHNETDHHLMYQIVSSAIVNIPPPNAVLSTVHRNAKIIKFDEETREEMLDLFKKDVNGKAPGPGKKLLGRRNWCLVEPMKEGAADGVEFSIMVENEDWKMPSVPYKVEVPAL